MKRQLRDQIMNTPTDDMNEIFEAALERFRQVYPEWEISVTAIERNQHRNQQIERMIALLEKLKE